MSACVTGDRIDVVNEGACLPPTPKSEYPEKQQWERIRHKRKEKVKCPNKYTLIQWVSCDRDLDLTEVLMSRKRASKQSITYTLFIFYQVHWKYVQCQKTKVMVGHWSCDIPSIKRKEYARGSYTTAREETGIISIDFRIVTTSVPTRVRTGVSCNNIKGCQSRPVRGGGAKFLGTRNAQRGPEISCK